MEYDKTVFKPEEIDTLGRYRFAVAGAAEENSGSSDASPPMTEPDESTEAPGQFDLGDFKSMEPSPKSSESAASTEDQLPLLGGPEGGQ